MDLVRNTKIDFLGKRRITFVISIVLVLLGLVAAIAIPMGKANLSTDFEGGIAIQFRFQNAFEIDRMRVLLAEAGFKDANLQQFAEPTKLLVKLKRSDGDLRALSQSLGDVFTRGIHDNPFTIDSTTEIGPTVGKKLQKDALWAVLISMIGILLYVAWRFEFRFGVAAVAATFHDVLAVLGVFFLLDKEMSLLVVTALLTVAGYSLTDTVVVFDRIRENMRKRTKEDLVTLINRSLNEVLSRTIVTSLTTLLAALALTILGGEVIHDFALALVMGVIVGTFSSIFIASPLLLYWKGKGKQSLVKV
ncbi:MAG TPA: protein translocase subunit SecF [Deltaproteobacteria bacterium]|nr:MAG: protein-export membrane protein SecF [Deltaproteobacteria bacterium GWA2_55_82]OGQ62675.1 MAG: protein-export membrane protein SecF [Deltaproteobacteria bacterium RIFCSPLOWO2_02_FULL_55_12]OIJ74267.1 MAG: protein-export membrane protein SecF [Deltaproteobacteria bacterium GWC2_55_46]HBG46900.1 protein translocase subunit SecF [Deltaproteobacteria bacterium]HCY11042.1 protein translocase subunit SecF [Deltaproteobacteria bacterium]